MPRQPDSGDRRPLAIAGLASVAIYATLCLATALVWEPAHDEGTTWDQAVAHLPLALGEPVAIERLYALAAGAAAHAPREVLASLRSADGMHPPAYYLFLNRWIPWTGGQRLLLLLPALALGVAGLFAVRRIAARVAPGAGAGEAALWLLAISPWLVGHSVLARPYAVSLAIAALATDALLRSLATGRARDRALFAALSVLGLYTLYHYAFVVAWQLALAAAHAVAAPREQRRRESRALAATAGAIAIGYAPWIPSLLAHLEVTRGTPWYFVGRVPLAEWPRGIGYLLSGLLLGEERAALGRAALEVALAALALGTLPLAVRSFAGGRLAAEGRTAQCFWWTAPLLPALVAAADAWQGTHTLFVAKTGFALPVLLGLLVVRAAGSAPARLRRGVLAAWSALALGANASEIARGAFARSPAAAVVAHLRERSGTGDLVVLSSARPTYVYPLLLALRDAGVAGIALVYAPPALLRAEGAALAERAGARSLTLVNLDVAYDRSTMWDPALLREVAERARASGFRVERVRRAGAAPPRAATGSTGERRLWILSPIQVRYFPG
jgi:hypothetical protein